MWGFEPKGGAVQARMVVALSHENGVGLDARSNDKKWLWLTSDLQSFPLAHGEKVGAIVLANDLAHFRCQGKGARAFFQRGVCVSVKHGMVTTDFDDVAALDLKLLLQEIGQSDFADETQALGIFFVRRGQSEFMGQLAHFGLLQFSNGKKGARQLCLVELAQEIALVFVAVCPSQKVVHARLVCGLSLIHI